jgi:hypothetical protein
MAVKAIFGDVGAVVLNLAVVQPLPGWNKRRDLRLDLMVPQLVAAGRVLEPIHVWKDGTVYRPDSGHRRVAGLRLIQDIQAGTLTQEEAKEQHGLGFNAFHNATNADVSFGVPAIVGDKADNYTHRLMSLTSNTGIPLAPLEQAEELAELKKMTYGEFVKLSKTAPQEGRDLTKTILNKDLSILTGLSEGHISGRLSLMETPKNPVAEKIQAMVVMAVKAGHISAAQGQVVVKSETLAAATDAIASYVAARTQPKAPTGRASAKAKLALQTAPPVAPPVPSSAPVTPSSAPTPVSTDSAKKAAMASLVSILDTQGMEFVKTVVELWAKEQHKTVPWGK